MKKKIYNNYFFRTIFFTILFLGFVATTNFLVDPEKIYTNKNNSKNQINLEDIINKLRIEKGFFVYKDKEWNDRDLYNLFSKTYKDVDCIVFGASSVVTISVVQKPSVLSKHCKTLLNLGLPGATFEDYFALSNNFSLENFKRKKIFLSIHPFTLNFNKDSRWIVNSNNFYKFLDKIKFKTNRLEQSEIKRNFISKSTSNLLSYDYFNNSLKLLINKKINKSYITNNVENIDLVKNNVIIFDGSKKKRNLDNSSYKTKIDLSKVNYKIIKDKWFDNNVLELLLKYKNYFEKNNQVIFLLTPYHPDVKKLNNEPIVSAINIVERKLHEFSEKNQIDIIGTYDADKLKCSSYEFFDAVHPSNLCLKRLDNLYFNYSD